MTTESVRKDLSELAASGQAITNGKAVANGKALQ
jgi:hypothetical protein